MCTMRDAVLIKATRAILEELEGVIADMYGNAKIDYYGYEDDEEFWEWLNEYAAHEAEWFRECCEDRTTYYPDPVMFFGRSGGTITTQEFWDNLAAARHSTRWGEDFAGESRMAIDIKEYMEDEYSFDAPEDSFAYAKECLAVAKFINEFAAEAVAGVKSSWEEYKTYKEAV